MKCPGGVWRLALYCLLVTSLWVQFSISAGVEETSRTPQFEPEARKNWVRNGGRTRKPKHKATTITTGETQRPLRGQLNPSYNPFIRKPASTSNVGGGVGSHGFMEGGGDTLSGLSGSLLHSTQLPSSAVSSTLTTNQTPQRSSEFLKGKSKNTQIAQILLSK